MYLNKLSKGESDYRFEYEAGEDQHKYNQDFDQMRYDTESNSSPDH